MLIKPKKPNCISHDRGNKVFQSRLSSRIQNKTTPSDLQPVFVTLSTGIWSTKHFLYYQITKEVKKPRAPTGSKSIPSSATAHQLAKAVSSTMTRVLSNTENKKPSAAAPPQHFTKLCWTEQGERDEENSHVDVAHTVHFIENFFSLYCPSYHYFV